MTRLVERIPWVVLVIGTLTLGLAPFQPRPHLVEKLSMLMAGDLVHAIDVLDLLLHGVFPALLCWRIVALACRRLRR